MHGGVDHDRVRERRGEPVGRLLTAMGGAVVDDPEHALGPCVGFLAHDLRSQVHERDDAGAFFGAAEYLRGVDVVGGEAGQDTAASVGVIDAHRPGLPGARVGWQRQRAWMEVFSSALITYSSSPSCSPCQVRAYRSSTQAAFNWKPGWWWRFRSGAARA